MHSKAEADDKHRSSKPHPSVLASYPLGKNTSLCSGGNLHKVLLSKDLLVTSALMSFYTVSNKLTKKKKKKPSIKVFSVHLLPSELAFLKVVSLRFLLLLGSIARDA